jgi:Rod binding domain-containing protein
MELPDISQAARPLLSSAQGSKADEVRRLADSGEHERAGREMETVFGMMLVRELRRALPEGLFGKGPGADVFEGWFDEHLGKALAERDALGLAGMVKTSLRAKEQSTQARTETPR